MAGNPVIFYTLRLSLAVFVHRLEPPPHLQPLWSDPYHNICVPQLPGASKSRNGNMGVTLIKVEMTRSDSWEWGKLDKEIILDYVGEQFGLLE